MRGIIDADRLSAAAPTRCRRSLLVGAAAIWAVGAVQAAGAPVRVSPQWTAVERVSNASVTLQVCPEPPMWRGGKLHDPVYKAIADLDADYVRLQPWFPYPRVTVAELKAPEAGKTYWDFSRLDQITEDFMAATHGRPVVFSLGVVPSWMFDTTPPVAAPDDPNQITWSYDRTDPVLSDRTIKLYAAYQARLAGWYLMGGFTDENGQWHASGHHYKVAYWEPFNEPSFTKEETVRLYDATVAAVHRIAPEVKFAGPAFEDVLHHPDDVAYFLDPKHHQPGIPIDLLTYHWYSQPDSDEPDETMQFTMFERADTLIAAAGYIETLRKAESPGTLTGINELGSILPAPTAPTLFKPIPKFYWNLSGAMWAYIYGHLSHTGVSVFGAAEIIDYPGQFAASSLVNWDTGEPNARYWVVKLLRDNFGPGDKVLAAEPEIDLIKPGPWVQVYAQGFVTPAGDRRLLVVNKRGQAVDVAVTGATGGTAEVVDGDMAPRKVSLSGDTLSLAPYAVAVVTLPAVSANAPLSADSTVGQLLDDPRGKAALARVFPEMLASPQLAQSRSQPLRALQTYAPTYITDAKLKALDDALAGR